MIATERITACTNCGLPYHHDRRLRQGRCSACYQWWVRHGVERPPIELAAARTRKKIAPNGRTVYGKSCPACGAWITMRATHCAICAALLRAGRAS